jgi:thiamine-phosphate diphosphorylase
MSPAGDRFNPLVCLVTDRRRLGGDEAARFAGVVSLVTAAVEAGVDFVQLREPDLPAAQLLRLADAAVGRARGSRTRIVVNDRLDVALASGAHGVHLKGNSVPASRVRPLVAPGFLIGRSVHGAGEAAAADRAGGLDYVIVGTVFQSRSKPAGTVIGPGGLARAVRSVSIPVLAIGGVTLQNAALVARTGAHGIAAVGLFLSEAGQPDWHLSSIVASICSAFDTSRSIP